MVETRRKFLATSGTAVSATLLGSLLFEADQAIAAPVLVRRNVASAAFAISTWSPGLK
jgi:anaerobic selenocysteine-containing dehydrogenase